jgi:hypothetical protein
MKKPWKDIRVPLYEVLLRIRFDGDGLPPGCVATVCQLEYPDKEPIVEMSFLMRPFGANTCAHESVHAAYQILHLVGIPVDFDNHEALAYLVGWVAEQCNEYYLKLSSAQEAEGV